MTCVGNGVIWHGFQSVARPHAAQLFVAQVGAGGLDRVDGAFGQVKSHGPVIGDGVDHVRHARVDGGLAGPRVGANVGHIGGQVAKERHAQLGVLLVARVVGQLLEALGVKGLPDQRVERRHGLRHARTHGVELVLVRDDLRAGRRFEAGQVKPVRRVAHRSGGACHGHANAVVAKTHANIANYQRFSCGIRRGARGGRRGGGGRGVCVEVQAVRARLVHNQVLYAQNVADGRGLLGAKVIDGGRVVAKLLNEALFAAAGLLVDLGVLLVAKDACRPILTVCHCGLLDRLCRG